MRYSLKSICTLVAFAAVAVASSLAAGEMLRQLSQVKGVEFDEAFLQAMIQHHQSGIQMSRLAENRASRPEVKQFAAKTARDQESEVNQMQSLQGGSSLARMVSDQTSTPSTATTPAASPTVGSVTAGAQAKQTSQAETDHQMTQSMSKLEGVHGDEFDRTFIEEMIKHHQTGVEMAQMARSQSATDKVLALGDQLVTKQSREIEELRRLKK